MTENQDSKRAPQLRTAWVIYVLLVVVLILVLVFFVAADNEERLFYSLMAAGVAWAFRPTEKFMLKQVERFTGQSAAKEE